MVYAYTIDASVVIKLVLEEADSQKAASLFGLLARDEPPILYVPDLLYVECANILWKYAVRFGYDPRLAQAGLEHIAALELVSLPTKLLFQEAFELAREQKISAYDAVYLALSQAMRTDLITADDRLVRKLRPGFSSVRLLRDCAF